MASSLDTGIKISDGLAFPGTDNSLYYSKLILSDENSRADAVSIIGNLSGGELLDFYSQSNLKVGTCGNGEIVTDNIVCADIALNSGSTELGTIVYRPLTGSSDLKFELRKGIALFGVSEQSLNLGSIDFKIHNPSSQRFDFDNSNLYLSVIIVAIVVFTLWSRKKYKNYFKPKIILVIILLSLSGFSTLFDGKLQNLPDTGTGITQNGSVTTKYLLALNANVDNDTVAIKTIDLIKGYFPKEHNEENTNHDFRVEIIDKSKNVLWQDWYSYPQISVSDPKNGNGIVRIFNFSISIPFIQGAAEVIVYDRQNNLEDTKFVNMMALADYSSPSQIASINIQSTAKVKILVMGDDYLSSEQSEVDSAVPVIKSAFFSYEPYKMRQSQIEFNIYHNTDDLGCKIGADQYREFLDCDAALITKAAVKSKISYDKVLVIYKSTKEQGAAQLDGSIAFITKGKLYERVAVHELSHTLGLADEYTYDGSVTPSGGKNCSDVSKNYIYWTGIVGEQDYYKGCTSASWYRSSSEGMMNNTWDTTFGFNAISVNILNNTITNIAGTYSSLTPAPNAVITYPLDGATVNGTLTIKLGVLNTQNFHRTELWIADKLIKTNYDPNASYVYAISSTQKNVKIEVRAYDGYGRKGLTGVITVNKTGVNPTATPTTKPTATPTPISGSRPVASASMACAGTTPKIKITWTDTVNSPYWVDISETNDFGTYWHAAVTAGTTKEVLAADNFTSSTGGAKMPTLQANKTYYIRVLRTNPSSVFSLTITKLAQCPTVPTNTPTKKPTSTPTRTPSNTPKPTSTATPTLKFTSTPTPVKTIAPQTTNTPTPTLKPTLTATPTPTQTPTGTLLPTATPHNTFTPTPTPTGTIKPSHTPTITPTNRPSEGVICGPIDVNGDDLLNIYDLSAFSKVYRKKCIDETITTGCGGKDVVFNGQNDKEVNIRDFVHFSQHYYTVAKSCKLL